MTAWPILAAAGAVGACVGSYAATAALRAAKGVQSVRGRSRCDGCGESLGFQATIPVLSFVALRGRCVACGGRIHPAHPIGEAAGLGVGVAAFALLPLPEAFAVSLLGVLLLALAVFDAETRRLPDVLTAPVAALGLWLAWEKGAVSLVSGLAAAAVAFAALEAVRRGFLSFRGKAGLGFGDVKLIAALALWLGMATPWAVVAASLLGLLVVAIARPADGRIAFGPMIALAGFAVGLAKEAAPWALG